MKHTDDQTKWYLVYTKPHNENIAKANLINQNFHVYLPLLRQHKRRRNIYQIVTEPLFPRYIFISLNSEVDDLSKIRSTRGCISLVRFGAALAQVPEILIRQLREYESSLANVQESSPDFKPGDRVRVVHGIVANYEGIIESKNSKERITLLLTIAEGHTRSINLSINEIEMIG